MSRRPRLDAPDTYHHVYARGVLGMVLFHDDADRHRFLAIVLRILTETGTKCLAWALMTNHYHLVLIAGPQGISKVVQRINLTYAKYYNRRYGSTGHVFQGRFGSKLVGDQDHLVGAIGYVHLNAVKAGIVPTVAELAHYPWSGHAALMGKRAPCLLEVDRVLILFAPTRRGARAALQVFLRGLVGEGAEPRADDPLHRVFTQALTLRDRLRAALAGVDAIESPTEAAATVLTPLAPRLAWRVRLASRGWTLDRLIARVCELFEVDVRDLRSGRRMQPVARARAVIAYLGSRDLEVSGRSIARATGVVGSSASRAISRGRAVLESEGISAAEVFDAPGLADRTQPE